MSLSSAAFCQALSCVSPEWFASSLALQVSSHLRIRSRWRPTSLLGPVGALADAVDFNHFFLPPMVRPFSSSKLLLLNNCFAHDGSPPSPAASSFTVLSSASERVFTFAASLEEPCSAPLRCSHMSHDAFQSFLMRATNHVQPEFLRPVSL